MTRGFSDRISQVNLKLGLALVIWATLAPVAEAQLYRGGVAGTVVDPQNAAVAEVKVTLTNMDTGIVQTVSTNATGLYRSPVDAGTYLLEFAKAGFQTQSTANVHVTSAKDSTVNVSLKVGAVSTKIDVTAEGIVLDKESATVRLTLPGQVLDDIPMSTSSLMPAGSRNFARYALFTAGVSRVLGQNETSANGHRGRENNYMLDGADNNDQTVTLPALFVPPEAIREVDIQAATFSAEYGRNIGAQVNVITRSGTNTFRGELWEFYRGNALEPLSLVSRKAGQKTPPRLVDNQFGGSFGGPIMRNRTFVFGVLQGNLLRTGPRALSVVTIPTPAGYAALQTVPLRSTPAAQTAASRQAILQALSFLPEAHSAVKNYDTLSTTTVNGTAIQMGSYLPVIPTKQNIWYGLTRIDHQLSNTDKLTYRGHIDHRISPLSSGNLRFGERWAADSRYLGQNHFIGYTKSLGSNFINEARVSYSRLLPSAQEHDRVTPTTTITGAFQLGGNAGFPDERLEQTYQFQNVSSYIRSKHSLKIGFDLARTKFISNTGANSKGTWTFSSLQNFLNNQSSTLLFLATPGARYQFHQLRQAYFIQDAYKVSRNLTANLGLRYETSSVPLGLFGAPTPDVLAALGQAPVKRDKNNWGPRAGFAYSPEFESGFLGKLFGSGQSSIRGGYGIGYDVLFYSLHATIAGNSYPYSVSPNLTGAAAPIDVYPALPPSTIALTSTTGFVNANADAQNPMSNYWTLSIQRQIHTDYSLELGYNGNRSHFLIRQGQANPGILPAAKAAAVIAGCTAANLGTCQDPTGFAASPSRLNPAWGTRQLLETTGNSSYNAFHVQFTGRSHSGLSFGANYSWSATLSDSEEFSNDSGSSDGGLAGSSPQVPQDFLNVRNDWARSVFDRPHRMTVHYNYEIPWFQSTALILNQIFKGWQWSGFTELQSGSPFTIKIGVDALGNGSAAGARPDYNPRGILTEDTASNNLRTFVIPKDGTGVVTAPFVRDATTGTITFLRNSMPAGGNLGRNTFRGPGYANFNMSLAKKFTLPGERQLQVRGDFINVFNHDNFPNPDNSMTSANFGKQIFAPLTDARQVLLGVKLAF